MPLKDPEARKEYNRLQYLKSKCEHGRQCKSRCSLCLGHPVNKGKCSRCKTIFEGEYIDGKLLQTCLECRYISCLHNKVKSKCAFCLEQNKDVIKQKSKEYKELHKDMIKQKNKEYKELNKDVIKEKRKIYTEQQ